MCSRNLKRVVKIRLFRFSELRSAVLALLINSRYF